VPSLNVFLSFYLGYTIRKGLGLLPCIPLTALHRIAFHPLPRQYFWNKHSKMYLGAVGPLVLMDQFPSYPHHCDLEHAQRTYHSYMSTIM